MARGAEGYGVVHLEAERRVRTLRVDVCRLEPAAAAGALARAATPAAVAVALEDDRAKQSLERQQRCPPGADAADGTTAEVGGPDSGERRHHQASPCLGQELRCAGRLLGAASGYRR